MKTQVIDRTAPVCSYDVNDQKKELFIIDDNFDGQCSLIRPIQQKPNGLFIGYRVYLYSRGLKFHTVSYNQFHSAIRALRNINKDSKFITGRIVAVACTPDTVFRNDWTCNQEIIF